MEFNLLSLLGISLAAMFFGYFFGLFEGRGQGLKKQKSEEPSDKIPNLSANMPLPASPATSTPERSVLKLSLDAGEQPRLDLDGQRVDTTHLAGEQRKRLIALMLVMRPWVEGVTPAVTTGQPITPTHNLISTPPPTPTTVVAPVIQPSVPEVKPSTMVGQIDAILQSRLANTPLAMKGVKLIESTQGEVVVMVGLNRFAAVGDVPDPDVQAAIRAAIAEWEEKYTPG